MAIRCIWEHNGDDSLLYSENHIGAYTRGESRDAAVEKMPAEIASYCRWLGKDPLDGEVEIVESAASALDIRDADSDVLFAAEARPLSWEEYRELKALALRSAADFLELYRAIPDKEKTCLLPRRTFYGQIPRTSREMYDHTKNVSSYYFGELGVEEDNDGSILDCRRRGLEALEAVPDFLTMAPVCGSYGESWSVRKVLRRFVWHDRIHAKAMYRMACKTFGRDKIPDIFRFDPPEAGREG